MGGRNFSIPVVHFSFRLLQNSAACLLPLLVRTHKRLANVIIDDLSGSSESGVGSRARERTVKEKKLNLVSVISIIIIASACSRQKPVRVRERKMGIRMGE
jgi:hypothetical protein